MAVTEAGGVVRNAEPCTKCGRPRSTLMVPSDTLTFTNIKGEPKPIGTLTVTLCMACDGGVEWRS